MLPWKSKSGPPSSVGVLYVEKLFRDLRNLTKTQQAGLGKTTLVTAVGWKQNLCSLCGRAAGQARRYVKSHLNFFAVHYEDEDF